MIGSILDVVADIRRGSPTYLKWISVELSDDNFRQIYVPPGFAHGICITTEFADVEYKCTDYYDPIRRAAHRLERPCHRNSVAD